MLIKYRPENYRKNGEFPLVLSDKVTFLTSGPQPVLNEDWNKIMSFPNKAKIVQDLIDREILEVIREDDEINSLSWIENSNKALRFVESTANLDLLLLWQQTESRSNVLAAIERQIALIKEPPVNEKGEDYLDRKRHAAKKAGV